MAWISLGGKLCLRHSGCRETSHIVRSQKPSNLLRHWHIAPDLEVHQNRSVTDWTTQ